MKLTKALDTCMSQGGRLCTLQEMEQGVTRGSGCGRSARYAWTRTSCGSSELGETEFIVARNGDVSSETVEVRCALAQEMYDVRCCADAITTVSTTGVVFRSSIDNASYQETRFANTKT
jgi:hypothetical protein